MPANPLNDAKIGDGDDDKDNRAHSGDNRHHNGCQHQELVPCPSSENRHNPRNKEESRGPDPGEVVVVGETTRNAIAITTIKIAGQKNERDVGGEGGDSTEDMDPAEDVGAGQWGVLLWPG